MDIGIAQTNSVIGDFPGNVKRNLAAYRECLEAGADLVITPELSLPGYPPRDLVFKSQFVSRCLQAPGDLAGQIRSTINLSLWRRDRRSYLLFESSLPTQLDAIHLPPHCCDPSHHKGKHS